MWRMSSVAQQVLATSHAIAVRATAYTAALGVIPNLPISGGSVSADATSQVRRTASITIADPTLWPAKPLDILSALGSELGIEYGIVIPGGGTEWVPLIQGVITSVTRTLPVGGSGLAVELADRSSKVAEDEFTSPVQIGGGSTTYVQAITALVTHLYPTVVVHDTTGNTALCPVLDVAKDRWADGVEHLTLAIGAEAFFDQVGALVIRPQPTLNDPIAWRASTGPGGVLVTRSDQQKRELVYNQTIVTGMRSDGTSPVYAVAQDLDPTSPTVVGGAFGIKTRRQASALVTTQPQAVTAAAALLERARGEQATVDVTQIVNPALAPGDVLSLRSGTSSGLYIIDKVTTPLDPGTAQQITTRGKILPPES